MLLPSPTDYRQIRAACSESSRQALSLSSLSFYKSSAWLYPIFLPYRPSSAKKKRGASWHINLLDGGRERVVDLLSLHVRFVLSARTDNFVVVVDDGGGGGGGRPRRRGDAARGLPGPARPVSGVLSAWRWPFDTRPLGRRSPGPPVKSIRLIRLMSGMYK